MNHKDTLSLLASIKAMVKSIIKLQDEVKQLKIDVSVLRSRGK